MARMAGAMMVVYFYNVCPDAPHALINEWLSYLEDMVGEIIVNRSLADARAACSVFDSDNNEWEAALDFFEWFTENGKSWR